MTLPLIVKAQEPTFIYSGAIRFERKENLHFLVKDKPEYQDYLKNVPEFRTVFFQLQFDKDRSLYSPITETKDDVLNAGSIGDKNVVFQNKRENKITSEKWLFDKPFLIVDSLRKINWKITGERRTIAGFECIRANAIIMDSVYIVAFYTNEIVPGFGPESFSGLPGMILGLAIPHNHVSWFATEIDIRSKNSSAILPPAKGEKIDQSTLCTRVVEGIKNIGNFEVFKGNYLIRILL